MCYQQYPYDRERQPKQLAWHETLELHELVAFSSIGLIKLKKRINKIKCPTLRTIYSNSISELEINIKELLQFYPLAPRDGEEVRDMDKAFYAGDLLGFFKAAVRNYAVAITETATPELRMFWQSNYILRPNLEANLHFYISV